MFRIKSVSKLVIKSNQNVRNTPAFKCKRNIITVKDLPHPRSLPVIGTKFDLFAAGGGSKFHEYIDRRHKQLGSIFCENLSSAELVFVSDPQLMKSLFLTLEGKFPRHILPEPWLLYEKLYGSKRGLLFMDGEEWLTNRRILNKHILREDSEKWLEDPLKKTISNFITKLKSDVEQGVTKPDLETDLYRLTTNGVISILLGANSSSEESSHFNDLLNTFADTVKTIFETTTELFDLPVYWCQRFNLKVWRNFKDSADESIFLAQKLVKEMLKRRDQNNGLIGRMTKDNVPDEIIMRIVADFVIAAGDTTAYTTLWTLFLLSENIEAVNELRQGANIKNVIKESMRLFPVAPFLTRIVPKKCLLGPYTLNEGTPVVASIYTSGRDEQNFSKANMFLPYRWDRNDARRKDLVNHEPSASLPFAMGARSCVGRKIAMIQLTNIIEQVVNNFDFESHSARKIKAKTSGVLVPDKPLDLVFSLRR